MKISGIGLARAAGIPQATLLSWKKRNILPLPWLEDGAVDLGPRHVVMLATVLRALSGGRRGRDLGDLGAEVLATIEAACGKASRPWLLLDAIAGTLRGIVAGAPEVPSRLAGLYDLRAAEVAAAAALAGGGTPEARVRRALEAAMAVLAFAAPAWRGGGCAIEGLPGLQALAGS